MAKFLIVFAAVLVGIFGVPTPENAKIDPSLSWRIVGGADADEGAYPYQISMRGASGSHSCGGSIIGPTTVLTAAHCVAGASPSRLSVVVGSNKLNSGGVKHAVKAIKAHEKYNSLTIRNDIALLILASPITYSSTVAPIELETEDVAGNVDAVLSGWGTTSYPGSIPNNLQYLNLKTISVSECKKQHPLFPTVNESQVCTLTQKGEGACHGDSGGPLVSNGKQIGVVSWGTPCAKGKPDVFTRVSAFGDWIQKNAEL